MEFRDQVGHEISSLSAFVDSVAAPCVRLSRSVAFIDSSERFFQYIAELAACTQEYLRTLKLDSMTGEDFDIHRQELKTIRDSWRDLHPFIKPAANADTLNIPLALLESLAMRMREINDFNNIEFIVFHTDDFNYLQVNPSRFRLVINKVALNVGAKEFDEKLALIGIPSSQSSSLFMNCLLAHEIGHFVYDRKSLTAKIKAEAETAVKLEEGLICKDVERNVIIEMVARWAEELFCDLLAVMLIGPSYTFAYIELFDMVNLLNREAVLCEPKLIEKLSFYWDHPSHIFRIQQQTELLKLIGWWDQIKAGESRHVHLMEQLLIIGYDRYSTHDISRAAAIKAFVRILPEVHNSVGQLAGKLDTCTHDFALLQKDIREYLRNGIVPSLLTIRVNGHIRKVQPTDITTINAAFIFYLEEVGELLKIFTGPGSNSIKQRSHWMNKIESWTAKALGDLQLSKEFT